MHLATRCLIVLLGAWSLSVSAQSVVTITGELNASGGVAVGPDGNVYVADFGAVLNTNGGTTVYRITPAGETSVFAEGFDGASGNAFDADGNLYQSNIGGNRISKVTPDGTVTTYATTGIASPVGVAVDSEGNVYNTNCAANSISKTTPGGATSVLVQSALLSCPNGLTVDENDNLYTANFNDGRVVKVTPDGTASVLATVNTASGNGHLTYANRRLYVCNWSGRIYEVRLDGASRVFAGTGTLGTTDGPANEATFFRPNGISASVTGDTLYINQSTELTTTLQLHPNVVRMITGVLETVDAEGTPDGDGFGLAPSAPNPFRSATRITYTLPRPMSVSLQVYDLLGRAVRTLVARNEPTGTHAVHWDGRSDAGQPLASGVYLYALEGAGRRVVRRVTLLR